MRSLFRRQNTSVGLSGLSMLSRRYIRTQLPPRPAVTVITYLDHYGNVIKGKEETDLSLIRTRDNRFYLQRVFANETVLRFHCPGLNVLKHASNFEYFSLSDIDNHGGVTIPADIFPTPWNEPPGFLDAVYVITKCIQTSKFTRKQRRSWHRRLFAHWQESPEKYSFNFMINVAFWAIVAVWLGARYAYMLLYGNSFWEDDARPKEPSLAMKSYDFANRHPEHTKMDVMPIMMSPAQHQMSQARTDLRAKELTDYSSFGSNFVWKIRHAWYYKHWPKGINDD